MREKTPETGRAAFVVVLVTVALLDGRVTLDGGPDTWPLTGSLLGETFRGPSPLLDVPLIVSDLTLGLRRERVRDSAVPDDDDIATAASARVGECSNP